MTSPVRAIHIHVEKIACHLTFGDSVLRKTDTVDFVNDVLSSFSGTIIIASIKKRAISIKIF